MKKEITYSWEEKAKKEFGIEETEKLIAQQNQRVKQLKEEGNDCKGCGWKNEGTPIRINDRAILMHYGMWSIDGTCNYCRRKKATTPTAK